MKQLGRYAVIIFFSVLVASCAYQVPVDIKPSYSIYSSYDQRLPGTAAIFVDSEGASDEIRVSGLTCSAHKFPVNAEFGIEAAIIKTLDNLIENIQRVEKPLSQTQLSLSGAKAMIIVKVEDMDVDLKVIPGFLSADMESEAEVVLGVIVETKNGRQLGKTVSGDGEGRAAAGGACEGGAKAIAEALEEAVKDVLSEMGEEISNSERLRKAMR
ncbi:hypothetical protein [Marichromatium gracile]|nr:hypothetical protein [Marichromatium gracile]